MNNLDYALELATQWKIFPCKRSKEPLTPNGFNAATQDENQIKTWWTQNPDALIGIPCRNNGLFVIDLDLYHPNVKNEWNSFVNNRELRATGPIQNTQRGGMHVFYKNPLCEVIGHIIPHVDTRDKAYVCSGDGYSWVFDWKYPIPDLPDWLLDSIRKDKQDTTSSAAKPQAAANNPAPGPNPNNQKGKGKITLGERNTFLTSYAGRMRQSGMGSTEIEWALFTVNAMECDPPLSQDEVKAIAKSVSRYKKGGICDDDLATKWLENFPDTAFGQGDFRRYQNGIWAAIPFSKIEREIMGIMEDSKSLGFKPSSYKLKSILEMARIKVSVDDNSWNANPDIIVCKNGTLEIEKLILRSHAKEDYQTSGVPYDYNPMAHRKTWNFFIMDTVVESADFLQEFAGYSLTTETKFETAVWLYGGPGTGKSTFLTGLQAMLGARCGLLGLADIEKSRFALGTIPGKTLLVSSEQPSTYLSTSYLINSIISGETVTVERKFKDAYQITPQAKLLWAMNELPRVPEADNGLFRRVKVVNFAKLKNAINPNLKVDIFQEGAGILNWALEGLKRLNRRGGFDIPSCVENATKSFQVRNDIPAVYISERCEMNPLFSIQASALYKNYQGWCIDNGLKPQSSVTLAEDWRRLGLTQKRGNAGIFWTGLRII